MAFPMGSGALRPHRFRKSRHDDACECRKPRSYRVHQSFWWRWLHPGTEHRQRK